MLSFPVAFASGDSAPCLLPMTAFAMTADWWLGAALGAGLGILYGCASYALTRYAACHGRRRFMVLFFGGMIARMAVALVLVALVLVFLSVPVAAFIGSLLIMLLIGFAVDVAVIHRSDGV